MGYEVTKDMTKKLAKLNKEQKDVVLGMLREIRKDNTYGGYLDPYYGLSYAEKVDERILEFEKHLAQ